MRDNKAIASAAGCVILGWIPLGGLSLSAGFGPRIEPAIYQEIGRVLARQTLALLQPGGQVTVITRDTTTFPNPATEVQLSALRQESAKAGVKINSIETLRIDPLRPIVVPAGDFFQWIKNAAKGNVLVSLMGPPQLSEAQLAQMGEVKPAIVAFCSGPLRDHADLRSLFTQRLLRAAVVSKRPRPAKAPKPLGAREAFDREFVEVTPENVADLSTVSRASP